jgi:hypothetical protein
MRIEISIIVAKKWPVSAYLSFYIRSTKDYSDCFSGPRFSAGNCRPVSSINLFITLAKEQR